MKLVTCDMSQDRVIDRAAAEAVSAASQKAARAIPPAWPLASSVAVNPYLGQINEPLAMVAARLARVAGSPVTMPRSWYLERIKVGSISDDDLAGACDAAPRLEPNLTATELKAAVQHPSPIPTALPTIADLAAEVSGIDWPSVIAERLGAWMAGYFDQGQAMWAAPKGKNAYAAWRAVATHDLTPEIIGLRGFTRFVSDAAEAQSDALACSVTQLGLNPEALITYFHQLLVSLRGWAHYARHLLWQAELSDKSDETIIDLLTIRLLWEEALFAFYGAQIADRWESVIAAHARPLQPSRDQQIDTLLQDASERGVQRALAETLTKSAPASCATKPLLQAAFCIDVRSEVFRRALESVNPNIQTKGFAGFFGVGTAHHRFASDIVEHRLPVLLNPVVTTCAGGAEEQSSDQATRYRARAARAWGRFKLAAVSSFAFVEAAGTVYAVKLVRDALGVWANRPPNDPLPSADPALDLPTRAQMAESVLRAMSLTRDYAPLVLLIGHGANVVNNPHASAMHCGACGGYSGEANARLLAGLLNDADVRIELAKAGLTIPSGTLFIGALHDTTTDVVTLYANDHPSPHHHAAIADAQTSLAAAGVLARGERALRLPRAKDANHIARRSRDWSETRPEWALAGCTAFIAAPRAQTIGKSLEGRAFLHDYAWREDSGFGVLELIMTAPVVVASWISLQYYGSTVAPNLFGGGNKLLHNVVGGIGVVEGNGGKLRAGLPWQSIHDGRAFAHEPLRLTVCIEAPREAMIAVLERHPDVRALFDNHWLHLFALDDDGQMAFRYSGDLAWTPVQSVRQAVPELLVVV